MKLAPPQAMGPTFCVACRQEIPDLARVCPGCGRGLADPATSPAVDLNLDHAHAAPAEEAAAQSTIAPSPDAPAPAPRKAVAHRDLVLVACAIAGSAVLTFAMLTARSLPDPVTEPTSTGEPTPRDGVHTGGVRTWSSANQANWAGNQRGAVAVDVEADNTIGVWTRTVRPSLVVRCAGGNAEVFVFTESAAKIEPQTDDHTVTFSFDDGDEMTERWPDSTDHDALFAPDGAAFARRLAGARVLRFTFTPHNAPPARVTFQVAGLDGALASAARACWNGR